VIPGIVVTVNGTAGAKSAVTDGEGRFSLPFLTPGSYALRPSCRDSRRSTAATSTCASIEASDDHGSGDLTESVTWSELQRR